MAIRERKNGSTNFPMTFLMVQSSDHITGITGATVTVTLSKNGASFGAAAGAVTEIGSGWYSLAGNATDRNTTGALLLHATATSADPTDEKYTIVQYDPFLIFDSSNRVDVGLWLSQTVQAAVNGFPKVDLTYVLGTILSESAGAGKFAAALIKLFNVATPTAQADNLPLNTDYTAARATKLDNLDAAITTRSTYAGADTAGTTTLLGRILGTLLTGNHNPQSGDAYARLGAAGVGLTNLGDTRLANLDATVSSRAAASALATLQGNVTSILADYARRTGDYATVASLATLQGNVTTILADYARRTGDYATVAALAALQANVTTILTDYARRTGDYSTVAAVAAINAILGTPAGPSMSADIATLQSQTNDIAIIKSQTERMLFTADSLIEANSQPDTMVLP